MRLRFLDFACCPECQASLTVDWREPADGDRIDEGALRCSACARQYPIIGSIPRLLPDALAAQLVAYHPEFFARHGDRARSSIDRSTRSAVEGKAKWWRDERRTIRSYSYQWRKFKQMFPQWEDVFVDLIRPLDRSFFKGKVGLDGGCGFGRSIYYAATFGAEMIGLDLSEAIEAARENTAHLPNVHLVQGDIFHPPIRRQSLDFVYSFGVLHHLPDPKAGFTSLSRLVKPGGPMFVWVYLRGRGRQIAAFTAMRALSTRMPLRVLNVACLGLAIGQWCTFLLSRRVLAGAGATDLAKRIPFSSYVQFPFRTLHTDWFDGLSVPLVNYYKPHEIAEWYRDASFERIQIEGEETWNGRALGYRPAVP